MTAGTTVAVVVRHYGFWSLNACRIVYVLDDTAPDGTEVRRVGFAYGTLPEHEATRSMAWKVSDAPEDFIAQQARAIIGLEIRIDRLEGKWKMSQNRSAADIDGVIAGLGASGSPADRVVADIVAERRPDNQ